MTETPFIITIDTEGDDLWARPREITTRNAQYLPRFQSRCERFRFKPVYLTKYEMAMSDVFVEFVRNVIARSAGEIGMHLHAWNSPRYDLLPKNDNGKIDRPRLREGFRSAESRPVKAQVEATSPADVGGMNRRVGAAQVRN